MNLIKINLALVLVVLSMVSAFGQIGINTENPQSTLDISAASSNVAAGLITPRQTRQQLIDKAILYSINQRGAIVYVTDVSGGTSTATANIRRVGYYYYDGILWRPFGSASGNSEYNWLITGNGNLSTTRGTNYLGTTDDVDLVLKTNGAERMTVSSTGNVGVGASEPSNKLHLVDTSDPMKLEGLVVSSSSSDLPLVVGSDGMVKTGVFPSISIAPDDVGTVIVIDEKLVIAQEIAVLMADDFAFPASTTTPVAIGNLTDIIIDNGNSFASSSTTNSFSVEADGIYLITLNAQLISGIGTKPFVGVWCDTDNLWVAGVNDITRTSLQTYTLSTAINLYTSKTYSLRVGNTTSGTIPWKSSGYTGEGPIFFYSLKRLK